VKEVIGQVWSYCISHGIRYAVATNGNAWIIFRAIREDIPPMDGDAVCFANIEFIIEHFTHFWNLLSYQSVSTGTLDSEFGSQLRVQRELHRVRDILFNADLPLERNRLNAGLQPLIKLIFEDIADQAQLEILQSCYVHYKSLMI